MITKIAFFLRSILYGSGVCDDPQSNDHAVLYFQTLAPLSVVGNLKQTDEIAFCQIAKVFGQITYFKMPTNPNKEKDFTFLKRWIKPCIKFSLSCLLSIFDYRSNKCLNGVIPSSKWRRYSSVIGPYKSESISSLSS